MIFDYPEYRPERRHGPEGYAAYESYRPWLRDEFTFRCIYCLKREAWGQATCEFELDHFEPQSIAPSRKLDYFNLVYACRRCNLVKLNQPIANPLELLTEGYIVVLRDGGLVSGHPESRRLIRQLDLNSPTLIEWRRTWMDIVEGARRNPLLYRKLVGFPDNLPNLRRLRAPKNSRPEGIEASWHARKLRGNLPMEY